MSSTAEMSDMLRRVTVIAGGEAPDAVWMNPKDFFVLRGVFGRSPWRLRIDMRRLRIPFSERREIMRDWVRAHPHLKRLARRF